MISGVVEVLDAGGLVGQIKEIKDLMDKGPPIKLFLEKKFKEIGQGGTLSFDVDHSSDGQPFRCLEFTIAIVDNQDSVDEHCLALEYINHFIPLEGGAKKVSADAHRAKPAITNELLPLLLLSL